MPPAEPALTVPDLVLLALLTEWPMHGYEANQELERRQVHAWAGISRPQVYYSLAKLERLGLIVPVDNENPATGPDRRVFRTSAAGLQALADSLSSADWAHGADRPKFLTWLALSWRANPGVVESLVAERHRFVHSEIARQQEMLRAIRSEVGHEFHEAIWMVTLSIEKLQVELRWLVRLSADLSRRAPVRNPS